MQHKPQSIPSTHIVNRITFNYPYVLIILLEMYIISPSHSKCHGLVFTEEVSCIQLREPHPHTPGKDPL